jgi:hypothetical protein
MGLYKALLGLAAAIAIHGQASAQTPPTPTSEARLRAAIADAERARDQAAESLRKADEAIALLKRSLPQQTAPMRPVSATAIRAEEVKQGAKPPIIERPENMPACDAPGNGGIGDYVLQMGETGRQKKETSYDGTERGTNRGINAFVYHCLGLTQATDYENVTNLSAQFTGTKGSDQIEAVITRTARALKEGGLDKEGGRTLFAGYNRYSLGGFGRTGSNGDAPLIDLTTSNFASGVGVSAGFEWGQMSPVSASKLRSALYEGVAKARQDCVASKSIVEPLTSNDAKPGDLPQINSEPLKDCEGDALVKWMSQPKRANQYWTDIVAPLWGYKATAPAQFAGVQGRYAFQDISFRPVIDRATGAVIVTTLPPAETIHPRPFSVKFYGGINRPLLIHDKEKATIGTTGSLTYRREVDFIDGTSGKTVCLPAAPGAAFDICSSGNLAAPYSTTGFVGGIALNLQLHRFWYLPPIGFSPRLTYAFDTKRPGIEVPVFFLTDADGKLNSGFKYTCRFRGRTPEGFELKKTCNINLFVGTSFEINKTP